MKKSTGAIQRPKEKNLYAYRNSDKQIFVLKIFPQIYPDDL